MEKIIIAQNPNARTLHPSDRLQVLDENGKVIGTVNFTHNICLSIGDIRIELTLDKDDNEKS